MSNITETQQDSTVQDSATKEFAKLLEESFEINQLNEGKIVKGTVVSIESDLVIVDVGLKTEGRISLSEFSSHDGSHNLEIGGQVDVYLEPAMLSIFEILGGLLRLEVLQHRVQVLDAELEYADLELCERDRFVLLPLPLAG